MLQTVYRVSFTLLWLAVGVVILGRGWLVPDLFGNREPTMLNLTGVLALVLAAYNALRLVMRQMRKRRYTPVPEGPLTRPQPERPREYNPAFDFDRPSDQPPSPPTANP